MIFSNSYHLMLCVKNRSTKIAELLLEKGANVNEGADDGVTPLALACANGDVKMVNFLLDNGANPMTVGLFFYTPSSLDILVMCETFGVL